MGSRVFLKYTTKNWGHRVCLRENEHLFLWRASPRMKPDRLSMCMRCERALMTQEIMHRKDAQCNSMESP